MTARTNLQLQSDVADLDEDRSLQKPQHFYDLEENFWKLREAQGDMPDPIHNSLVEYLKMVLLWYYRAEKYVIDRELKLYDTYEFGERPLYPDIFVIKSREELSGGSYHVGVDGPAPEIVIEVVSNDQPSNDLEKKPPRYEEWGVSEYFVYDPRPRKRNTKKSRLTGWRLVAGKYQNLKADEAGRIWSEQLDSWLVPDEQLVRLYAKDGNRRLTKAEAEEQAKDAALLREDAALSREVAERQAKEEALRREAALRQELERMAEKLRQLENQ